MTWTTSVVTHTVSTTTNFTINVTACNLNDDLDIKDFVVTNTTTDAQIGNAYWTKTSRTVLTYTGTALTAGHVLEVQRQTDLDRVQPTLLLASVPSSTILDAETDRIYWLINEIYAKLGRVELAAAPISYGSANPVTSSMVPNDANELYIEYRSTGTWTGIIIWHSTTTGPGTYVWVPISSTALRNSASATPVDNIVSDVTGQLAYNSTGQAWISTGTSNDTEWVPISGGGGEWTITDDTDAPPDPPADRYHLWFETDTLSGGAVSTVALYVASPDTGGSWPGWIRLIPDT